jgi:hypothetical protein
MIMFERLGQNRFIPKLLIITMLYFCAWSTANAAIVTSAQLVTQQQDQIARDRLVKLLDRQEVKAALIERGVDPAMAVARVATMTPEEVHNINQKIDDLPAGGSSLLGAAVLIFLVLLFTDIMGWTDIFPFVKKTAN